MYSSVECQNATALKQILQAKRTQDCVTIININVNCSHLYKSGIKKYSGFN